VTGVIARDRRFEPESLVRPLAVVDVAPFVKGALTMGDVVKASSVKDFGLQGAMEPLVLALV